MADPTTYLNATVSISTVAQNVDINEAAFEGLSYTEIANVGTIGQYGNETNMVNYPVLARALTLKAKGQTDGGRSPSRLLASQPCATLTPSSSICRTAPCTTCAARLPVRSIRAAAMRTSSDRCLPSA